MSPLLKTGWAFIITSMSRMLKWIEQWKRCCLTFKIGLKKKTTHSLLVSLGTLLGEFHHCGGKSSCTVTTASKDQVERSETGREGVLWSPSYASPQLFDSFIIILSPASEMGPKEFFEMTPAPAIIWLRPHARHWEWWPQPSEPPEIWVTIIINNYGLFHTTTFLIICYAVIDNWKCFKQLDPQTLSHFSET